MLVKTYKASVAKKEKTFPHLLPLYCVVSLSPHPCLVCGGAGGHGSKLHETGATSFQLHSFKYFCTKSSPITRPDGMKFVT